MPNILFIMVIIFKTCVQNARYPILLLQFCVVFVVYFRSQAIFSRRADWLSSSSVSARGSFELVFKLYRDTQFYGDRFICKLIVLKCNDYIVILLNANSYSDLRMCACAYRLSFTSTILILHLRIPVYEVMIWLCLRISVYLLTSALRLRTTSYVRKFTPFERAGLKALEGLRLKWLYVENIKTQWPLATMPT